MGSDKSKNNPDYPRNSALPESHHMVIPDLIRKLVKTVLSVEIPDQVRMPKTEAEL